MDDRFAIVRRDRFSYDHLQAVVRHEGLVT